MRKLLKESKINPDRLFTCLEAIIEFLALHEKPVETEPVKSAAELQAIKELEEAKAAESDDGNGDGGGADDPDGDPADGGEA